MVKKASVSTKKILKAVVSLSDTVTSLVGTVAELPTRDEVDAIVEKRIDEAFRTNEQLKKIDAISKAVDKDAETIIRHDKRITRVESHLAIK